ncbi:MAG: Unknown protein [uncultured Sulfurovum sp.]|uniref:Uncharacterized protein n=1 Tax=uncultured Sulfurovum sp. TaxID=269237 RepID=A0A6S6SRN8_9BACT|nr:MAG: Unknown protein [uncultured Sulfurovum sp.]
MKKVTPLFLSLSLMAMAGDNFLQTQYTSLKKGSVQDQAISMFGKAEHKESFLAGDLDIEAGITANAVLKKSSTINFFNLLNDNDFLIHQLSANYYLNNQSMISLGRENMNLNLLNGSFDGALIASSFDDLFVKAFYFKHYAYLAPTLYLHGELDGLSGFSLNYSKGWFDSELTYFNENAEHRSTLYLGLLKKPYKAGIEHMQYLSSTNPNERAYKLHMGMKVKNFYAETGFMHVYEGGLQNIYVFGGSEFNAFGLTSFLNNQDAKNGYIHLIYNHKPLYTKLHLGQTDFNVGTTSYLGKEAGVTVGYRYKDFHATVQGMTQKSDEIGFLGNRTSWIHSNLEYRF